MKKVPKNTVHEQIEGLAREMIDLSFQTKGDHDVQLLLESIAYGMGSILTRFFPDDRGKIIMKLTESIAEGMMDTSKKLGEPFDFTVIVAGREGKH